MFTVVVTERDYRKKIYKGSENADRKKKLSEQQLRRVDKASSRAGDIEQLLFKFCCRWGSLPT